MTKSDAKKRRVFISYSWTSQAHVDRIMQVCTRLVNDGVDVKLDKWELKEGHDKYAFMESMVTDAEVDKVIIFCDEAYSEKANKKKGGVGTESQIISKEIYEKVKQDKFIPVVFELKEDGEAYLPVFLQNRIYIDFSSPQKLYANYEQLLRTIYDRPQFKKPKLGSPPSHIFEDSSSFVSNRTTLEVFNRSLVEDKSNYIPLARSFLNDFLQSLENYRLTADYSDDLSNILRANLSDMLQARNELLQFYDLAFSFKGDEELFDAVLEFLEGCLSYNYANRDSGSFSEWQFENYRFFNHESFIYLTAFLLRYRRFGLVRTLLEHRYYINSEQKVVNDEVGSYLGFYSYSRILDDENKKQNQRRISPDADLFKERATNSTIDFSKFMQADFTLFLFSILNHPDNYFHWYPVSLVFSRYSRAFELYQRAEADNGFEVLKLLLNVSSREDLKERFTAAMEKHRSSYSSLTFHGDVRFFELMNFKKICNAESNA